MSRFRYIHYSPIATLSWNNYRKTQISISLSGFYSIVAATVKIQPCGKDICISHIVLINKTHFAYSVKYMK